MNIFLNYSSNYTAFLRLGNITIYQENPNGTKNVTLSNSTLSALLDYNSFNQKTVPLRFGITNATSLGGNADAVLVSDVSGSMDWCSKSTGWSWNGWQISSTKGCLLSGGVWWWGSYSGTLNGYSEYNRTIWNNGTSNLCSCRYHTICQNDARKLDIYINSSLQFADIFYNMSSNRLGLVEFSNFSGNEIAYKDTCLSSSPTTMPFPDSIVRNNILTSNKKQITDKINTTEAWWGTCTCCGINKAVDILNSQSNVLRKKYIVLMSDGAANVQCAQQPNSTAIADAVQSASDACNQGISVYAIAYGADADTATMQRMNCSGGKYYDAVDTTKLQQAYNDIAGQINKLSFSEQTVNITGLTKSTVYPNSYIEFNYTVPDIQFNKLPLGFETDRFGNNISSGTLTIYPNTSVSDAKVTSYSGSKWTDNLIVNGNTVYRLSDYGNNYQILGDPFTVNIPIGNLNEGSNSITISTGTNLTNSTGGSSDDRVIYILLLNGVGDYSSIVAKAAGCSWTVSFEDGTTSTIKVPSTYSGADACSFSGKIYDTSDALNNAVYQLFSNLDFDKNGKLNVNIDESNLNVNTLTISKVPSLWGPAIIEIRVWQ